MTRLPSFMEPLQTIFSFTNSCVNDFLFLCQRFSLSLSTDSCVNYFLYQLFSLTTIFSVNYFLCQRFPLSTIFSMNFSFIHCQHRKSLTNNFYKSLILTIIWTFYKYLFLRQNFSLVSLRNLSTKSLYHYFIRREGMAKDFLEKKLHQDYTKGRKRPVQRT